MDQTAPSLDPRTRFEVQIQSPPPYPPDLAELASMPAALGRKLSTLRTDAITLRKQLVGELFEQGKTTEDWKQLLQRWLERRLDEDLELGAYAELQAGRLVLVAPPPVSWGIQPGAVGVTVGGEKRQAKRLDSWSELAGLRRAVARRHRALPLDSNDPFDVLLAESGALVEPQLAAPIPPLQPGQILDLGRGSLLLGTDVGPVLVDPWLTHHGLLRVPEGIAAVVLRSADLSRLPLDTLLSLDPAVPIVVPPRGGPHATFFRELGSEVHVGNTNDPVVLGPSTHILFPAEGVVDITTCRGSVRFGESKDDLPPAARCLLPMRPTRLPRLVWTTRALFEPPERWFECAKPLDWPSLASRYSNDGLWLYETGDRYAPGGSGALVQHPTLPEHLTLLPGLQATVPGRPTPPL